jgi:hypothetical protein
MPWPCPVPIPAHPAWLLPISCADGQSCTRQDDPAHSRSKITAVMIAEVVIKSVTVSDYASFPFTWGFWTPANDHEVHGGA